MAIKDIKFMNGEGYLLKDLPLTLDAYIQQMKLIEYDGFYDAYRDCRDDSGVEATQFPPVVFAFYNLIFSQGKLPTPKELLTEYYNLNTDTLAIDCGIVIYQEECFRKKDLDARILRTYPSLVRDYHFYLMLVQEQCFDKVVYSCKSDLSGKDLIVQHKDQEYSISLFVQTKRATLFKRIKDVIRHPYSGNDIPLPLNLQTASQYGEFFVYSPSDVKTVKSIIFKKQRKT